MGPLRIAKVARYPNKQKTASHDAATTDHPYFLALLLSIIFPLTKIVKEFFYKKIRDALRHPSANHILF